MLPKNLSEISVKFHSVKKFDQRWLRVYRV